VFVGGERERGRRRGRGKGRQMLFHLKTGVCWLRRSSWWEEDTLKTDLRGDGNRPKSQRSQKVRCVILGKRVMLLLLTLEGKRQR
jgi:hypothetical protein